MVCALLTTAHTITGVCIAHAKTKECVGKIMMWKNSSPFYRVYVPQLIYFLIHLTTPIMGGSHFACRSAPLPVFEVVYSASI